MIAPLHRRADWPERLAAVIQAAHGRLFCWSERNCAFFAADAVRAMTGWDAAARVRGRMRTRRGAMAALARYGAADVAALMAKVAAGRGLPEIAPGFAQRGDVVLVETERGPALGICTGRHAAVPGRNGLVFNDMRAALKAWRVG